MNTNLRVATLPVAIVPADKEANLDAVEKALEKLPEGTDIVVLPELFSTGYTEDSPVRQLIGSKSGLPVQEPPLQAAILLLLILVYIIGASL